MEPRELPNLTVGNCPTMGPEHHTRFGQRSFRWLVACSLGLLVAAGVTFSLVAQPAENTKKSKTAVVEPEARKRPAEKRKPMQPSSATTRILTID